MNAANNSEQILNNSIELVRLANRLLDSESKFTTVGDSSSDSLLEVKIKNCIEPLLFYLHMGFRSGYRNDRTSYLMKAYSLLKAGKNNLMLFHYLGYGDTTLLVAKIEETMSFLIKSYPRILV